MATVQTILIPKDRFTRKAADQWINKHGYKVRFGNKTGPHETDRMYRYRQRMLRKDADYRTHKLPNGVELVIMFKD